MVRHKISRFGTVLVILLHFKIHICHAETSQNKCTISGGKGDAKLLRRLDPLNGNVFTVKGNPDNYLYKVGICTQVDRGQTNAGAVQYKEKVGNNPVVLGLYNETQVLGGRNWVMLIYTHGQKYHSHCGNATRRMQLVVICDPDEEKGEMQMIEERKENGTDCMYLFELNNKVVCTETHHEEGLSSGSVFCILFFTIAGLYFCLGFLYQRIIVGAKGLEQIPNYNFWKEVGYLEADGCDFVCRCGPRYESQQYRGIGDHVSREEESERDDQLLTM